MKTLTKTILAVLVTGLIGCVLFSQQAQAVKITGSIVFQGTVDFDQAVMFATRVDAWHGVGGTGNPTVTADTGDFANYFGPGDPGTFSAPWFLNSGSHPALWSIGGFTFDLTSSLLTQQTSTYVVVIGFGWISGNGFDPTFGTWHFKGGSFGTNGPSSGTPAQFGFTAPETGSTVALLGLALVGMEALRRRLRMAR
jgi:hypothetical protein